MQQTAARSCEHLSIPGETHMDVNTPVTGGLGGSWCCPLCWEHNQRNKVEWRKGAAGSQRGVNWRENHRSEGDSLELVIHLKEGQDRLWGKATLIAHHDVKEIPKGNIPSLLTEGEGRVKPTRKGNLETDIPPASIQKEASYKRMHMVWLHLQKVNCRQNPPTALQVWVVVTLGD